MIQLLPAHARALRREKNGVALLAAAILCLALVRCGTAPSAGGGSDLPNGAVAQVWGYVATPDSIPLDSAEVYLREIVISASGDSMAAVRHTRTENDGWFGFDSVKPGAYAVFCQSADGRLAAVNQFVRALGESDTAIGPMSLIADQRANLVGNVFLPPGFDDNSVEIFIPGTGIGVRIMANAPRIRYVLNSVPPGRFDLAILYGNIVNFLAVNVHAGAGGHDITMRDVAFAPLAVMADTALAPHPSTTARSYCITPQAYEPGQEPPWYWGENLDEIDYYEYIEGTPVLWHSDSAHPSPAYDTLVAGMAWRDSNGRVWLETFRDNLWGGDGVIWELTGGAVASIDAGMRAVVVAAIRREEAGRIWLEVVEMAEYALCKR